jgi:hypothetical protein
MSGEGRGLKSGFWKSDWLFGVLVVVAFTTRVDIVL